MSVNCSAVRALTFDVFGSVVDWRGSIIREARKFGASCGLHLDWPPFADAWRVGYRPAMDRVRRGEPPWLHIDRLRRMIPDEISARLGATDISDGEPEHLDQVCHWLRPWPDALRGLKRLKKKFIIATLSNGNLSLLTDMAKHSALPWDCILSAELFRHYKPDPETYLGAAALLGARPEQTMRVAAHEDDVAAVHGAGLRTAFVRRPRELGSASRYDLPHSRSFDVIADDFVDLADQMGV